MFGIFRKEGPSIYDEPIAKVLDSMKTFDPEDKEFPVLIRHLDELTKMKAEQSRHRVSPDTMLMVAGNLFGILIIVAYEQKHVLRSTATTFLLRAK